MAVTITREELQAALRLGDSQEEAAEAVRLLAYATEAITQHAPNAPDVAHNEAVRRLSGFFYDQPEAARGDAYANAMRSSGAARILLAYRIHRLGLADQVEESVEREATILIQQTPFTVTSTPQDIAASYPSGRYRAENSSGGGLGILYASGPQAPATDDGYFRVSDGASFDFESGTGTRTWVKATLDSLVQSLAVARYPGS